jgi:hypothetical protein
VGGVVVGGVVGGVTGGPLGVADGGLGFGRFLGCGVAVDGLGSVRVVVVAVAAGRTTTVGRTATRCG